MHQCKPSVFFSFYQYLQRFCQERFADDGTHPENVQNLETRFAMKIVITDKNDQDGIGFKQYRIALYVHGAIKSIKNAVMLIDDYVAWRCALTKEEVRITIPKITISLPNNFDPGLETDDMTCGFEILTSTAQRRGQVLEAQPPVFPKRCVVATVERADASSLNIVFSGNTMPFRLNFERENILGKSLKTQDTDQYGEYYRVMSGVRIDNDETRQEIFDLFGDRLFKGTPVAVRILAWPSVADTSFNSFVEGMKEINNVHFL